MNKEYKERMKRAEDAADRFFEEVKKTGDMEMFENNNEVQELYLEAFDIVKNGSEEEQDFFCNFTDYLLFRGVFLIRSGEFARQAGNKKILQVRI